MFFSTITSGAHLGWLKGRGPSFVIGTNVQATSYRYCTHRNNPLSITQYIFLNFIFTPKVLILAVLHLCLLRYSPQHKSCWPCRQLLYVTQFFLSPLFVYFFTLVFRNLCLSVFVSALYLVHPPILFYCYLYSLFCFPPLLIHCLLLSQLLVHYKVLLLVEWMSFLRLYLELFIDFEFLLLAFFSRLSSYTGELALNMFKIILTLL